MDDRHIEIVSDSTGETAEKVVRAAMLQFPHSGSQVRLHTRIRTKDAARPILEAAAREGSLVVFTVVSPEIRVYIHALSYEDSRSRPSTSSARSSASWRRTSTASPSSKPSGMLPLTEEYFRRIEAVEFAVKSDDGKEPRNFKKADLVLAGVSGVRARRRSPRFLRSADAKVANYPIVLGMALPPRARRGAARPRRRADHRVNRSGSSRSARRD